MKKVYTIVTKKSYSGKLEDMTPEMREALFSDAQDGVHSERYDVSDGDLTKLPEPLRRLVDQDNDGEVDMFKGKRTMRRVSIQRTRPIQDARNPYDLSPPEGTPPGFEDFPPETDVPEQQNVGKTLAALFLALMLLGAMWFAYQYMFNT